MPLVSSAAQQSALPPSARPSRLPALLRIVPRPSELREQQATGPIMAAIETPAARLAPGTRPRSRVPTARSRADRSSTTPSVGEAAYQRTSNHQLRGDGFGSTGRGGAQLPPGPPPGPRLPLPLAPQPGPRLPLPLAPQPGTIPPLNPGNRKRKRRRDSTGN